MKKFFTFLVLFITFSMNAQVGTYDMIQSSSGIPAIYIAPDAVSYTHLTLPTTSPV